MRIFWMEMVFLSWATLKSVVCVFVSLASLSLAHKCSRALKWFNHSIDGVFKMMSWYNILCFFQWTTNIFQYQYSVYAAAPIPIFGSIYRRSKCKMLQIDFFFMIIYSIQFYCILNISKLNFKGIFSMETLKKEKQRDKITTTMKI